MEGATEGMSEAIAFRSATTADIDEVVALIESAYRGEVSRAGWTTEDDLLDGQRTDPQEIGEIIGGSLSQIRLAHRGGMLVGCVRIEDAGDAGYIGMVSVAPTLQAAGVGRQLLVEAERIIRDDLHRTRARMTVIGQRDTLIAWYLRRGYFVTGRREAFPYGEPRAGLPKRADLYFEVLEKELAAS